MKTSDALSLGSDVLPRREGIPDPRREAAWLLAAAWGVAETTLRLHPQREVPPQVEGRYREVGDLEHAVNGIEWRGAPELETYARSIYFLAAIGVDLLDPIFARTDAVGSGMRRKIKPVSDRIFYHLRNLGHS